MNLLRQSLRLPRATVTAASTRRLRPAPGFCRAFAISPSVSMAAPREQPPWQQPTPHQGLQRELPPLKIWNSLTRSKTPFVPLDPEGKKVTWYACGPTVYDDAHLGHARNYVSADIVRRILRDYFKFDVKYIMNITDVDDKIITRGRQQHLYDQFSAEHPSIDQELLDTAKAAYEAYIAKNLPLIPLSTPTHELKDTAEKVYAAVLDGKPLEGNSKPGEPEAKVKMYIRTLSVAAEALTMASTPGGSIPVATFYEKTQDILYPHLDTLKGASIQGSDHSIFTRLTKEYEDRFMQDVRDLNVLDPDEITRVTEFMPEIVSFVERIIEHKFGYVTPDGSVYFDIENFEAAGNSYARLEPWNRNDANRQSEGEGSLSNKQAKKKSSADFALWKASKAGEPSWPSPWGNGRPGWHIECSAMASSRLGKQMDIHSGGIDLAFPHHDNEIAQSEAYWSSTCSHVQWVNYFIHMGHLSIQGSKMSKSLKNFTTIRDALRRGDWTPRSFRIVFLLGGWRDGIEITDEIVKAGNAWEEKVNNFFIRAKDPSVKLPETTSDEELPAALKAAQDSVHKHLCDSFNTAGAMYAISELITKFNNTNEAALSAQNTHAVAKWLTSMVNIFGLNSTAGPDSENIGWYGDEIAEEAKPYVYPLSTIRDTLRQTAIAKAGLTPDSIKTVVEEGRKSITPELLDPQLTNSFKDVFNNFCSSATALAESSNLSKEILDLCDTLRNTSLFDLGVYLEDRADLPARVRPVTRDLLQARQEAETRARQKLLEKEAREKEAAEKAAKGKISPLEMFRTEAYSAWDEDGLPLKDAKGEEITKSQKKKLKKEWDRQKKAHETWLASQKTA
ncbi:Cysteinyl-tRNA synthetase [Trichophyton interdigitale]|uniref:cysteine--tRNA ligase n=1 Tax=Trichophyton interdigitale TaxID=101480 RepID=A0A9P4YFR1_9EURO|nr:Cysteinyl-tRNA synthetase [Trichophyton interdigitale]KAF3895550.1 Cysteinyl-tRNA synthetase [Trichophyton interdigitale]